MNSRAQDARTLARDERRGCPAAAALAGQACAHAQPHLLRQDAPTTRHAGAAGAHARGRGCACSLARARRIARHSRRRSGCASRPR